MSHRRGCNANWSRCVQCDEIQWADRATVGAQWEGSRVDDVVDVVDVVDVGGARRAGGKQMAQQHRGHGHGTLPLFRCREKRRRCIEYTHTHTHTHTDIHTERHSHTYTHARTHAHTRPTHAYTLYTPDTLRRLTDTLLPNHLRTNN